MHGDIQSLNPDLSVILGNFSARSKNWWVDYTQTSEGSQINYLTTSYGFRQLISEPTHLEKFFILY